MRSEFDLVVFPVFCRADPFRLLKCLGKVAGGGKTQDGRDLDLREVCLCQEPFALPDAAGDQIVDRGDAVFPFEGVGHIAFVDAGHFRQFIQVDILFIVMINIMLNGCALAVGAEVGMYLRNGNRNIANSHYKK